MFFVEPMGCYRGGDVDLLFVVAEKHANFILNEGGATGRDLEELIAHVRATVRRVHAVELVPEVRTVGEPL